jgi:hypothetical protein
MIVLGLLEAGDPEAARSALEPVARALELDVPGTARVVVERMAELIAESVRAFLHFINARPVYTVREVLEGVTIEPEHLVLVGGPAAQMKASLEQAFGIPVSVPPHAEVANAVGAAASRVTCEITLHADTARGTVVVPEVGIDQFIDGNFDLDQGMMLARQSLEKAVYGAGGVRGELEITVTEEQSFNMIQGFSRTGKNIRLNLCVTPGLIPDWPRRS